VSAVVRRTQDETWEVDYPLLSARISVHEYFQTFEKEALRKLLYVTMRIPAGRL